MKGYRTFAFNAIMFAGTILGVSIAPETASQMIEIFAAIWGGGNMLLRGITDTPMFDNGKE